MDESILELPTEKPFIIELEQHDKAPNGDFRPMACLKLTPEFRASGLLRALPPEDVAWLMFLLTFLSPNGDCRAHLELLSEAMHVSKQKAEKRMAHLASFQWQGQPLITAIAHDSGITSYVLSQNVISYEHTQPPPAPEPPTIGGFRDRIIANSRALYARPRAEVERMIESQYGHYEPQTEEERAFLELRRRLENVGINSEQAEYLLGTYDVLQIERQLEWLPYRNAKNPAGFLIAAIEDDYEEPTSHRFIATVEANQGTTSNRIPNEQADG